MAAGEVLRQFVRRGLAEKVIQKRHDARGIAGRQCPLCVTQRRQIDMTHHILAAGLGRVAFPAGPNCRADTRPATIKVRGSALKPYIRWLAINLATAAERYR